MSDSSNSRDKIYLVVFLEFEDRDYKYWMDYKMNQYV